MNVFQKVATGAALALTSGMALATPAGPDVTAVEAAIEAGAGPIATIGAAVLVLLVGVKVYKWIRRAL